VRRLACAVVAANGALPQALGQTGPQHRTTRRSSRRSQEDDDEGMTTRNNERGLTYKLTACASSRKCPLPATTGRSAPRARLLRPRFIVALPKLNAFADGRRRRPPVDRPKRASSFTVKGGRAQSTDRRFPAQNRTDSLCDGSGSRDSGPVQASRPASTKAACAG